MDYEYISEQLNRILYEAQYVVEQVLFQKDADTKEPKTLIQKQPTKDATSRNSCSSSSSFLFMDRPKTRRNEDDELTSLEKFKSQPLCKTSCVDLKIEDYCSSFEALQAKLQAISEATESDASLSYECRAQKVKMCDDVSLNSTETSDECASKKDEQSEEPCNNGKLEPTSQLSSSEIVLRACSEKILRPSEIPSYSATCMTTETQTARPTFTEETQPGMCICPQEIKLQQVHQEPVKIGENKIKYLQIQSMQPISIEPHRLILQTTHHYSIGCNGQSEDLLKNKSKNVTYLEIYGSEPSKPAIYERSKYKVKPLGDCTVVRSESDLSYQNKEPKLMPTSMSASFFKSLAYHDPNEKPHVTVIYSNNKQFADSSKRLDQDEIDQREMIYKSYHLRDNPNLHDPDPLGAKSLTKISEMDMKFYETYINPMGLSYAYTPSRNKYNKKDRNHYKGFISDKEIATVAAKSATSYKLDSSSVWGLLASKSVQCSGTDLGKEEAKDIREERLLSVVNSTYGGDISQTSIKKDLTSDSPTDEEDLNRINTYEADPVIKLTKEHSIDSIEKISLTISYSTTDSNSPSTSLEPPSIETIKVNKILEVSSTHMPPDHRERADSVAQQTFRSILENEKIKQIRSKLQTVELQTSVPGLALVSKTDDDAKTTIPLFIKGLVPSVKTFHPEKRNDHTPKSDDETNFGVVKRHFSSVLKFDRPRRGRGTPHDSIVSGGSGVKNEEKQPEIQTADHYPKNLSSSSSEDSKQNQQAAKPLPQSYTELQRLTMENERKYGKKNPYDDLTDEELARQNVKLMLHSVKNKSLKGDEDRLSKVKLERRLTRRDTTISNEEVARQNIKDVLNKHKRSVDARKLTAETTLPQTTDDRKKSTPPTDKTSDTRNGDKNQKSNKDYTVMFSHIEGNKPPETPYLKHLELASNGRYKDEENLFCDHIYVPNTRTANTKTKQHEPPKSPINYPVESVASDVVTSMNESISEGEVKLRCKHTLSNGEVHMCKKSRNQELRKRNKGFPQRRFPKDPFVKLEQRRTYFDNWVTYYVKRSKEAVNDSTSSNSYK